MINQKEIALALGIGLIIPSTGRADVSCTASPDCSLLGYTKSAADCPGGSVKCPFDQTKLFCLKGGGGNVLPSKTRSTIWTSSTRTAPPPQRLILPKTLSAWLWFLRRTMVITTGLSYRPISRRRQPGQTRSSAATTLWSKAPRRVTGGCRPCLK